MKPWLPFLHLSGISGQLHRFPFLLPFDMELTNGRSSPLGLQAHSLVNHSMTIMLLSSFLTDYLASAILFCIYKTQVEFHNVLAGELTGIVCSSPQYEHVGLAQMLVQLNTENLQGRKFLNLSGKPVPISSYSEMIFFFVVLFSEFVLL